MGGDFANKFLPIFFTKCFGSVFMTMKRNEALEVINKIEDNVNICCNAFMDSDDVLDLLDKLKKYVKEGEKDDSDAIDPYGYIDSYIPEEEEEGK